jgi:hypothetical protein
MRFNICASALRREKKGVDFPKHNRYFLLFLYEVSAFPNFKAVPKPLQAVARYAVLKSLETRKPITPDAPIKVPVITATEG